jgi:excinuclease UvrABC nuclease subunit
MVESAAQLRFERASWLKRHVELLDGPLESQVVERNVRHDQDVVHFNDDSVMAMHLRRGAVCGYTFDELAGASVDQFLHDHYGAGCPAELIVNQVENPRLLEQRLAAATGHRVRVNLVRSERGAAYRLMRLCALNHAHRTAQRPAPPIGRRVAGMWATSRRLV